MSLRRRFCAPNSPAYRNSGCIGNPLAWEPRAWKPAQTEAPKTRGLFPLLPREMMIARENHHHWLNYHSTEKIYAGALSQKARGQSFFSLVPVPPETAWAEMMKNGELRSSGMDADAPVLIRL